MRSRLRLAAAVVAATAVITGCSATPDDDVLADVGLDGLTGQEIVARLDTSTDSRPLDFTASVREDEVLVGDGSREVAVPVEEGQFYVSIAPYVETTHECYCHGLATCQGELIEEPVDVWITAADGEVRVDETTTTYVNGFGGFRLPEGIEGTIEISHGDLSGTVPFTTPEGGPTYVTTLQLA